MGVVAVHFLRSDYNLCMNENIEGRYPEYLFDGIRVVRADRRACIVCGHPTGDCATDDSAPHHVIGVGIFKSIDKNLTVTVEKDIFEERQINPHYKAKVLLVRAGQKISVDKARELGLL
jgi:hypothetical protein